VRVQVNFGQDSGRSGPHPCGRICGKWQCGFTHFPKQVRPRLKSMLLEIC